MEDFVDIKGFPKCKINRLGECIGSSGRKLKPSITDDGYYRVKLYTNGIEKSHYIHRLVALTFIPNPLGLETINHKDENKTNNCVDNLEWLSRADNTNRRSVVVNSKNYSKSKYGWVVFYGFEGKQTCKNFNDEDDAAFYASLLKAIYPRF